MGSISASDDIDDASSLPYWQVNVSPPERTIECPAGLRGLSAKDIDIISTPDKRFTRQGWDDVRRLVVANRLDSFRRVPSELRRYRIFVHHLVREYGSIMEFVLKERLDWWDDEEGTAVVTPEPRGGRPFELKEDYKILYNDWPYGIDQRIVHLVVWVKFELEEDPVTGDSTDGARTEIDEFVGKVFRSNLGEDRVVWFKNWRSLKSVHAVEHFHVMLYDPPEDFVRRVTNGDRPVQSLPKIGHEH